MNIKHNDGIVRVNAVGQVFGNIGDSAIALDIDLHTKYAEVSGWTGGNDDSPEVFLSANEHTLHLGNYDHDTSIEFPELIGYRVHCASVARYTLSIAFVKEP